jgi:hypothetical protein
VLLGWLVAVGSLILVLLHVIGIWQPFGDAVAVVLVLASLGVAAVLLAYLWHRALIRAHWRAIAGLAVDAGGALDRSGFRKGADQTVKKTIVQTVAQLSHGTYECGSGQAAKDLCDIDAYLRPAASGKITALRLALEARSESLIGREAPREGLHLSETIGFIILLLAILAIGGAAGAGVAAVIKLGDDPIEVEASGVIDLDAGDATIALTAPAEPITIGLTGLDGSIDIDVHATVDPITIDGAGRVGPDTFVDIRNTLISNASLSAELRAELATVLLVSMVEHGTCVDFFELLVAVSLSFRELPDLLVDSRYWDIASEACGDGAWIFVQLRNDARHRLTPPGRDKPVSDESAAVVALVLELEQLDRNRIG